MEEVIRAYFIPILTYEIVDVLKCWHGLKFSDIKNCKIRSPILKSKCILFPKNAS